MLNKEEVDLKEEELRLEIRDLDNKKREKFYKIVKKKLKDPDTYAVLNWFLITGLHHFYLEKWIRGFFNLSIFIIGVIFILFSYIEIGIYMIVSIFLIELWALFNSQTIVQDFNNKVYENTLKKIR